MTRFAAFWSNDKSLNRWALTEERDALTWHVPGVGGLGLGWLQDDRSLLRRHPRGSDEGVQIAHLLSDLPSRAMLGCLEDSADASEASDVKDLAPYRFRDWIFSMDRAKLSDAPAAALLADLPDFLRRNVHGARHEELVFNLLLSKLHHLNAFNLTAPPASLIADAMAQTLTDLKEHYPLEQPSAQLAILSSRVLIGATLGAPIALRHWEGVQEPAPAPLFAGHRPKATAHNHFRAYLLLSGAFSPPQDAAHWQLIAPDHILHIARDGSLHTQSAP
jgi:hypothetical protein